MNFKEFETPEFAIAFLSEHLINGTLALFIGAGASKGFGFPDWSEFTNLFRKAVNLNEVDTKLYTAENIQNSLDEALDIIGDDEFRKMQIIRSILYRDPSKLDLKSAFSNHLLISISSLLMGSKRGHVKRVVSLNYDSMLEWYLSLLGFHIKTIANLPALEGSEDVRIYHPHGFAPHPKLNLKESNSFIIGLKDANRRIGEKGNPWFEKVRQILESNVCLFIGMSGNTLSDRAISPILAVTGQLCEEERPIGIWIYRDELTSSKKSEYYRNNIVPIEIKDDLEISEFILKISQTALDKQKNNL